jgi:hypothetical protein
MTSQRFSLSGAVDAAGKARRFAVNAFLLLS